MTSVECFHDCRAAVPVGIQPTDDGGLVRVSPYTAKLAADPGRMTLLAIITTGDRDRAGDVIVPGGIRNASDYLKNPVGFYTITYNTSRFAA